MSYSILCGDCLDLLPTFADNSLDALVTDPPAGVAFMGLDWDKGGPGWVDWLTSVMRACLRCLKPGAHALVWALPRTSHKTATAIELAGFEIRDVICHLFGSGFPKSHDISKAIDKAKGAERERIRGVRSGVVAATYAHDAWSMEYKDSVLSTVAITPEADQWQGWGTALKPAVEHWILARKPLSEKTVAANVLRWGTGGINIDGCRIGTDKIATQGQRKGTGNSLMLAEYTSPSGWQGSQHEGRFPANLILSHSADCQDECAFDCPVADLGEKARYFYCAKASRSERNLGCQDLVPERSDYRPNDSLQTRLHGSVRHANNHPTVKAIALMRYLTRLVCPVGGVVLDPFAGSGSTGCACVLEGMGFVGIEKESSYCAIANKRIEAVQLLLDDFLTERTEASVPTRSFTFS